MRMVPALFLALLAGVPGALAANTTARLVLAADTVKPGETVLAGVHLKMDGNWHTYWRNPGESGGATRIQWELPPGITAGEIQWPVPERYLFSGLTTFVYHNEVVLLVPLTIAKDAAPGAKELKAKVDWLECEKLCLPAKQDVGAMLTVGAETMPSADAALIEAARKRLPVADGAFRSRAWWEGAATDNSRKLIAELFIARDAIEPGFFPYEAEGYEVLPVAEELAPAGDSVRLRITVTNITAPGPKEISGVILAKTGAAGPAGFEVKLRPTDQPPADAGKVSSVGGDQSLGLMLLFAFIGGLILNIMPCVLPVIALKVLGFVQQSKESPATVRRHGVVYTLGVLCSFLVLAGVVIGVQQAGKLASWGMQFGNPTFVVAMTVLVTLVALNLFGVFEVFLGGGAMTAATQLASKEGNAGAFFNGVLATALATPCTAPFLGGALGYAFTQPPTRLVLMFLVVGFGLAVPYLLLSWNPNWMKFLPKPGAWMEKFKVALGFPVVATAIWLTFEVGAGHFGAKTWWLGIFLVILSLAAWVWGEFVQRGRKRRALAAMVSASLVVVGALVAKHQMRPDLIAWMPWTPEAVAEARKSGRPVFVDFTANWCLTCKANKESSIEIPKVIAKLHDLNAVALLGDYTLVPDNITRELQKFGRAGVPLVLVYPRDAGKPPLVLPELLTPGIVLDALEQAGR
jgi:thiol:disulfide interchange protein/DsbC/DsbD-like thiol-disulfide interchange protein